MAELPLMQWNEMGPDVRKQVGLLPFLETRRSRIRRLVRLQRASLEAMLHCRNTFGQFDTIGWNRVRPSASQPLAATFALTR